MVLKNVRPSSTSYRVAEVIFVAWQVFDVIFLVGTVIDVIRSKVLLSTLNWLLVAFTAISIQVSFAAILLSSIPLLLVDLLMDSCNVAYIIYVRSMNGREILVDAMAFLLYIVLTLFLIQEMRRAQKFVQEIMG